MKKTRIGNFGVSGVTLSFSSIREADVRSLRW